MHFQRVWVYISKLTEMYKTIAVTRPQSSLSALVVTELLLCNIVAGCCHNVKRTTIVKIGSINRRYIERLNHFAQLYIKNFHLKFHRIQLSQVGIDLTHCNIMTLVCFVQRADHWCFNVADFVLCTQLCCLRSYYAIFRRYMAMFGCF